MTKLEDLTVISKEQAKTLSLIFSPTKSFPCVHSILIISLQYITWPRPKIGTINMTSLRFTVTEMLCAQYRH